MKEHKSKRTHGAGDNGGDYRGAEQSKDTAQFVEFEWRAMEPLDEPRNNEWSTSIGGDKKRGAGKITIAEQIGCESGCDHADDDRPSYGRAERDQEPGGRARRGPEHRHPIRLVEQSEAEARCEKKNDRD